MRIRALEWRPFEGFGWAYVDESQAVDELHRIQGGPAPGPIPSSRALLQLTEDNSFLHNQRGSLLAILGDVTPADVETMRGWLEEPFRDLDIPDDALRMARILCDFTDDSFLFAGTDKGAWQLSRVRARLPYLGESGYTSEQTSVTILVLGTALITAWHGPDSASRACARFDAQLRGGVYTGESSTPSLCATIASKYVVGISRCHGEVAAQLENKLKSWQSRLVVAASEPRATRPPEFSGPTVLGELRNSVTRLRESLDDLIRGRIDGVFTDRWADPNLSPVAVDALAGTIQDASAALDRLRDNVSGAFLFWSTVGISDQLEASQEAQRRSEKLQRAVTLLSSFLLMPTLIATIFSANIALPGKTPGDRTVIMVVAMILGALATYLLITVFNRRN